MDLSDIGEFKLIEILADKISSARKNTKSAVNKPDDSFLLTIGDDAAAWNTLEETNVITTDAMVEGIHFDLSKTSWKDLGWKSLAVNLSDIAAMGCIPKLSTVSLGLQPSTPVEGITQLYEGMLEICNLYGGSIVGGDIVKSPNLFISIAMLGYSTNLYQDVLNRSSAQISDYIGVTGSLGNSAGGLRLLIANKPDDPITKNHLKPQPRVKEGLKIRQLGIKTAIDISDGLVSDIGKICVASGVKAIIDASRIPVSLELKTLFPKDYLSLALSGGEDYELLFTGTEEQLSRLESELDTSITVIGHIEKGEGVELINTYQNPIKLQTQGWDHFTYTKGFLPDIR